MGRYGMAADMWSLGVILYILLSGSFPFDDDHLFDQIEHAQYSFAGPEWQHISVGAKHLIRSLLTLRADLRLTSQQALQHPWITNTPFQLTKENLIIFSTGTSLCCTHAHARSFILLLS